MTASAWRSPADLLGAAHSLAAGDRIRTGDNFHPHYEVIALSGESVWVRDLQHGSDHIVPIHRCRKFDSPDRLRAI